MAAALEYVSSGGTASNTTINGGTEVVISGGVANGTITFVSGGQLTLDKSTTFSGVISGMTASTGILDLVDVPYYASGVSATKPHHYTSTGAFNSGTLTVVTAAA